MLSTSESAKKPFLILCQATGTTELLLSSLSLRRPELISIPVFIAKAIEDLSGGFLWLGGGDTDIKLRVSLKEFERKAGVPVIVSDISNPKSEN